MLVRSACAVEASRAVVFDNLRATNSRLAGADPSRDRPETVPCGRFRRADLSVRTARRLCVIAPNGKLGNLPRDHRDRHRVRGSTRSSRSSMLHYRRGVSLYRSIKGCAQLAIFEIFGAFAPKCSKLQHRESRRKNLVRKAHSSQPSRVYRGKRMFFTRFVPSLRRAPMDI
jgi:hypothetical protein